MSENQETPVAGLPVGTPLQDVFLFEATYDEALASLEKVCDADVFIAFKRNLSAIFESEPRIKQETCIISIHRKSAAYVWFDVIVADDGGKITDQHDQISLSQLFSARWKQNVVSFGMTASMITLEHLHEAFDQIVHWKSSKHAFRELSETSPSRIISYLKTLCKEEETFAHVAALIKKAVNLVGWDYGQVNCIAGYFVESCGGSNIYVFTVKIENLLTYSKVTFTLPVTDTEFLTDPVIDDAELKSTGIDFIARVNIY